MKRIRLADAKAHLSQVVASLQPGDEVTITRHGIAVAKITGVTDSEITFQSNAGARLRARAATLGAGAFADEDLVALVHEGRR